MAETSIAVRLGLTGLASTQAGLKRFFGLIDKEGRAASVGVGSLTAGLKNIALAAAGAASAYLSIRTITNGIRDIAKVGRRSERPVGPDQHQRPQPGRDAPGVR